MTMSPVSTRLLSSLLATAGLIATAVLAPAAALADEDTSGAVYTMTNATTGNQIVAFRRSENGALTQAGMVATGGNGTGTGLGSGHSVVTTEDGRYVIAVNAGSNSVSVLRRDQHSLRLVGNAVPSGGARPTSVTVHDNTVYVLNAGSNSIAGFRLDRGNGLLPINGSVQQLGAGTSTPSQIQFDASGQVLIVDERGSSTIDTFVVSARGVAGPARTTPSNAGGPFGFDVDRRGNILFSAVALGGGAMSGATSFDVNRRGMLTPNGGPVSSGQAAACWLAAAGQFAYTTNAASGSIGGFKVARDGSLSLISTTALGEGSHPLDEAVSRDQHFLYVLVDGLHQINGYRVGANGSLTSINSVDVPAGAIGAAAS
jgi:6-phosphogluconolactonase (cycloisomerase 2 family)